MRPVGPGLAAAIVFALGVVITVCSLTIPAGWALIIAVAIGRIRRRAQILFAGKPHWVPLATPTLLLIPTAVLPRIRLPERLRQAAALAHAAGAGPLCSAEDSKSLRRSRHRAYGDAGNGVRDVPRRRRGGGFTAAAEGMMPEAAASFLNAYFEALAEPLKRHGADLTQFHADSIMCVDRTSTRPGGAIQGVPRRGRGARRRPRVQRAARAASPGRSVRAAHRARFRRNAGAGGHFIYGIVGDIANTASRIEQLNKRLGTRLLATEEVVAGLDDILVRPLGDFLLAGKRSAVSVVEILSAVESATMAQLSLCARFQSAIDAFREERWEEAEPVSGRSCAIIRMTDRRLLSRSTLPQARGATAAPVSD